MNRVFFALPLPGSVLPVLERAQHSVRATAERLTPRWTRPEQMHVTLKFVGDQPDDALPRFAELLRVAAARAEPFTATLARVDAFGGRRARVLVAELDTASPVLARLAAGLEAGSCELGVPGEARPFRVHVTLARFKHPGDARAVIAAADLEPVEVAFREACLLRSELPPTGSRYAVLDRCPLGRG
ncbi:MAG: RNA 2',3'-cyclic phosphodiesterase [Myxococcales bacterium]|nr:RNA 2',3'-cyclic phosphodiesterase [Myxococcales bacterium]